MNGLEGKDVRVSMRDLLYYFLRKWRIIAATVLVCAILPGAYRGISLLSMIRSAAYQDQAWKLYEEAVDFRESETERLDRAMEDLRKKLEDKEEYQSQSLLMAMDPYGCAVATADLYLSGAEGSGDASVIADICQSALQKGSVCREIAERMDAEERYIRELVKVSSDEYGMALADGKEMVVSADKGLLHIGLIAGDEAAARELMDGVIAAFEKLRAELDADAKLGVPGNMAVFNYVCTSRTVDELATYQSSIRDTIRGMEDQLEDLQEEKDALEVPVYELMSMKTVLLSSLKYFLAGGLAGGIVSLAALLLGCLYSDRILSPDELRKHTGLRVYAVEEPKSEKKRLCAGIDRFIHRRELRSELVSGQMLQKWLELDHETRRYVTWGEHDRGFLNDIIPDIKNKTVLDMDEMDSWRSLLPVAGQEVEVEETQYILFADREKTTYQELERKLDMIRQLKGRAVMCVLYI